MNDVNVRVAIRRLKRISQGDIFSEIDCIEYVAERRGVLEVSKLVFPFVVVLTQDCDLEQDARYRIRQEKPQSSDDKKLFSALVAPLYNAEHVYQGQHLADLGLTMTVMNKAKTEGKTLRQNERPRYHYLSFPESVPIPPSIVDFKHYFSVNAAYLAKLRQKHFVCRLSELYREDLSQRFAAYLARIGLPSIPTAGAPSPAPSISAA
ncbi:MAG TPA: hypothetical protein VLZ74_07175 [Methylocella sp.]|nr:hypothetical protein [Methylocella sp.]